MEETSERERERERAQRSFRRLPFSQMFFFFFSSYSYVFLQWHLQIIKTKNKRRWVFVSENTLEYRVNFGNSLYATPLAFSFSFSRIPCWHCTLGLVVSLCPLLNLLFFLFLFGYFFLFIIFLLL